MGNQKKDTEPCGWVVNRGSDGELEAAVGPLPENLDSQSVCIDVEAAGFNYKDALACEAHPGIARKLPLVPGIDVSGRLRSSCGDYAAGTACCGDGKRTWRDNVGWLCY